jgi:poly(3-hydroxybutyrate) depolymerase
MCSGTRWVGAALAGCLLAAAPNPLDAQDAPPPGTIEHVVTPGANFDKAIFRLWVPAGEAREALRGTVVLVPGSNGDGRAMVADTVWQAFATKHRFALVACQLTDKPHEQNFIEDYVNVARGSGQALLDALAVLGRRAGHPEIAETPLFLWGMSAGGQFDYEFAAWKPERVIAFVVNKGGIYYTALTPRATRAVPALLFTGETDLDSRVSTITGLFALNRRGGALWALTQEPGVGHVVGRSRDFAALYFEDVLALRQDPASPTALKPLDEKAGFYGDLRERTIRPVGDSRAPATPHVWLPTERSARAWLAVVTGQPFER